MPLFPPVFRYLSPAGAGGKLSVFIFHRVFPVVDPFAPDEVDAARFDAICAWLAQWFNVLPLDRASQLLVNGELPERAAAITFDDGYEDNASVAVPLLARHGLTATFFVASDYLDGGVMWNDVILECLRNCPDDAIDLSEICDGLGRYRLVSIDDRRAAVSAVTKGVKYLAPADRERAVQVLAERSRVAAPSNLMMSSDQVCGLLQTGMSVGAHTCSHPILAKLNSSDTFDEISRNKKVLENLTGQEVRLFAYPNGKPDIDYTQASVDVVKACGFWAAVSTAWGAGHVGSDRFQLPRFTPWDRTGWRFGLRVAQNLRTALPDTRSRNP